jgi:hypothetical protein
MEIQDRNSGEILQTDDGARSEQEDFVIHPKHPSNGNKEPSQPSSAGKLSLPGRANKTSLRLKYEAEKKVIEQQIGSLETVRHRLGLSRRKICQLLLVDPSAWSRWTRSFTAAPPHIYRSLHWYTLLQEKDPALNHRLWLSGVGQERRGSDLVEWQRTMEERQKATEGLLNQKEKDMEALYDLVSQLETEQSVFKTAVGGSWRVFLLPFVMGLIIGLLVTLIS